MMEGKIEELRGSSGKLSSEVAQLTKGMSDNEAARSDATGIRDKENADFNLEEADMTAAIDQMDRALETLVAVGADQTAALAATGVTTSKFMGEKATDTKGVQVAKLSEQMQKALKAASVFLSSKQRKTITGFIQAPFTGEYSAQSGEIVGILKNMKDTFSTNLGNARAGEKASLRAFNKYIEVMTSEFDTMSDAKSAKEEMLGQNDAALGSSQETLDSSTTSKREAEEFLASLTQMCADKTREYEDRKMVRANEEAAVSQAISILNSDAAFDTFGGTTAAKTGATGMFLQMRKSTTATSVRKQVQHILTKTAREHKSLRLAKVAAQVEKNPFAMVINSIKRQMKVIDEEEKSDDDQKAFCDDERTKNDEMLANKIDNIDRLSGEIDDLTDQIENPETGLKAVLAEGQTNLANTKKSQAEETADRQAENAEYQKNIANLVEAEKIIAKAHKVLKKFYDWLAAKQGPHHYEEHSGKDSGGSNIKRIPEATTKELEEACSADPACVGFNSNGVLKSAIAEESEWYDTAGSLYVKVYDSALVQKSSKKEPAPPTDEFAETGESKGNDAIKMLSFILDETKAEEKTAHETEEKAQAEYEDTMTDLKANEDEYLATVASTEQTLAEKEKDRTERRMNLDATKKDKKAIEKYLLSIKPGCDFMDENLDARKESRRAEKSALENSRSLMEDTPEYQSAAAEEERAALKDCAEVCLDTYSKDHVMCKACVDKTTPSGYCVDKT